MLCRCGFLFVLCISPLSCLMVSTCPTGCCCPRPGLLVLCESLGLQSLPRSVPLNTTALSVARNLLCNVDDLLKPFSGLHELSLSQNQLSRFPRGLPPSLESLLLQENRITYITSGALRYLGNLTRLDLEYNQIRAIQPGAFQGLNKLQILTLKGNKLTNLPENLPASLTHLDVSANCISALDLVSLSSLVNLQVLKINSNCLRSVPEKAFDTLSRLRSVDLTNNLWVCECDILYLYRWLLSGRMKMATDLVCTEPVHLAHRLLLNLSVMAICPRVLMPKESAHNVEQDMKEVTMDRSVLKTSVHKNLIDEKVVTKVVVVGNDTSSSLPKTRIVPEHSLEALTYEECLSLNKTQSVSPSYSETTTLKTDKEQLCPDNVTGQISQSNVTSADGTQALPYTNRDSLWPTAEPRPSSLQDSTVVIALLAVLCVLVAMLMLAVLIVLKQILLRNQRVAPLEAGTSR